jgi:hypothetical protein
MFKVSHHDTFRFRSVQKHSDTALKLFMISRALFIEILSFKRRVQSSACCTILISFSLSLLTTLIPLILLAHMSWKLKWAILIASCLSVRPSDRLSVNFYILDFFSRTTGPILTRLGKHRLLGVGFHICSNEGDCHSPMGDKSESVKIHWKYFKNLLLQNQQPKINQTWYKLSMGKGDSSLFK